MARFLRPRFGDVICQRRFAAQPGAMPQQRCGDGSCRAAQGPLRRPKLSRRSKRPLRENHGAARVAVVGGVIGPTKLKLPDKPSGKIRPRVIGGGIGEHLPRGTGLEIGQSSRRTDMADTRGGHLARAGGADLSNR